MFSLGMIRSNLIEFSTTSHKPVYVVNSFRYCYSMIKGCEERGVALRIFILPVGKAATDQSIVPTAHIPGLHSLDGHLSDGRWGLAV